MIVKLDHVCGGFPNGPEPQFLAYQAWLANGAVVIQALNIVWLGLPGTGKRTSPPDFGSEAPSWVTGFTSSPQLTAFAGSGANVHEGGCPGNWPACAVMG